MAYAIDLALSGFRLRHKRAHALLLMIFTGLSALPFEQLESTPPEAMPAFAADRAELARFCLDLLEATTPPGGKP